MIFAQVSPITLAIQTCQCQCNQREPVSQFHIYWLCLGVSCLYSVFILDIISYVKAQVSAFNQEKAQGGAFSVIVKSSRTFVGSCSIVAHCINTRPCPPWHVTPNYYVNVGNVHPPPSTPRTWHTRTPRVMTINLYRNGCSPQSPHYTFTSWGHITQLYLLYSGFGHYWSPKQISSLQFRGLIGALKSLSSSNALQSFLFGIWKSLCRYTICLLHLLKV